MRAMSTWLGVGALGSILICATAAACSREVSTAQSSQRLRIAGGTQGATFSIVANALASLYSERLAPLWAEEVRTVGTSDNLAAVEAGSAECGIGSADIVYAAYLRGTERVPQPHRRLRGVAVLFPNAVHLATRADSGIETLSQLAGRRIAAAVPSQTPAPGRGYRLDAVSFAVTELSSGGQPPTAVTLQMDAAVDQLGAGVVDAAQFYGGYPFRPVTEASRRYGIRLVDFDDLAVSLVKEISPFSKGVVIPAGTYPGQTRAVRTVAIDNVLFCRSDLPEDLVYRMTRTLFEGLAAVVAAHASAGQIDPDNGAATPIPLHKGATRYYRERELFR